MKTVIVTGGSRGIGKEICLAFAKEKVNLVLCYAGNKDAAGQTVAECEALGAKALAVCCDVTDAAQVQQMIDTAVSNFGTVHVLINNAGITKDNLMIRMTEQDFDDVIDANLKGAFLCAKAVARIMMKQRYGRIIHISSVVGVHGNAGQANYAASKAGLIGLTKSMAKEFATRNITVNAVAPGFIETDMTDKLSDAVKESILQSIPAQRLGQAKEVADSVLFLASESAAYITGQVLGVDGGMGM